MSAREELIRSIVDATARSKFVSDGDVGVRLELAVRRDDRPRITEVPYRCYFLS